MDVTPQLIEQIDFSEKFRGYDPDQVDDFLERVGATIAELSKTAREATQRAERAEADLRSGGGAPGGAVAPAPAPAAAPMSDEEEAMHATRTLMMAKKTADLAVADAREEAAKIVGDARGAADTQTRDAQTEADRLVGEARVTADSMVQKATQEANREYGARRDQILSEIGELESRKTTLGTHLTAIESRLDEYRTGLSGIHGAIAAVLENPDAMLRDPIPGLDLPEMTTEPAESFTATSYEPPAEPEPAFVTEDSAFTFDSGAFEVNGTENDNALGGTGSLFGEVEADEAAPAGEGAPADPWGPGSWGEVSAFADPPEAFTPAADDEAPSMNFPSEGLPVIGGQDRYSQDLHEAVNEPDSGGGDDAMNAFFEQDDESHGRRFGRRR